MSEPHHALPDIDFATFVLTLGTSALMCLGELPDPATKEKTADLALAKQTIDLLGLLAEKTRGNLEEAEKNLLESLLYDLRVKYVDAAKKAPPAETK
jgi:hypothetical protein